jgi:hypothetical protein
MSFADDVADLFGTRGVAYVTAANQDVWHKRRKIRAFVMARLREAAISPERVRSESREPFQSRPDERQLPALNVLALDETSSRDSKTDTKRDLQLAIDVLAEGVGECVLVLADLAALDAQPLPACACIACKLDQYAEVIEGMMEVERFDKPEAHDLIDEAVLISSTKTVEARGDKRFGSIRLVFTVTYTTGTGTDWPD